VGAEAARQSGLLAPHQSVPASGTAAVSAADAGGEECRAFVSDLREAVVMTVPDQQPIPVRKEST
jgi:hypothetical protein